MGLFEDAENYLARAVRVSNEQRTVKKQMMAAPKEPKSGSAVLRQLAMERPRTKNPATKLPKNGMSFVDRINLKGAKYQKPKKEVFIIPAYDSDYLKADIPDGATAISYYKIERISAMGADGGDLLFDALSQQGVTAIHGVRQALDILVFPNPVSGSELKINGLPDGESIYKIYSISGYKMQEGIINHGSSGIMLNKNVKDQSVFILNITNSQKSISLILTNWPE